jgi:hypothetical protein
VCACPPQTDKATLSTSYKDVSRPVPSPVPLGASGSGWGSGHQFGGSATYQEFVTRPPSCESVPSHPFTLRSGKSSGWAESVLKVAGVATFPHRGAMLLNPSPAILVGIFSPLSENGSPSPAGILFSFPAGIFSRRAAAICTLGLSRRGPGHQFRGSATYQKFVTRPDPLSVNVSRLTLSPSPGTPDEGCAMKRPE